MMMKDHTIQTKKMKLQEEEDHRKKEEVQRKDVEIILKGETK